MIVPTNRLNKGNMMHLVLSEHNNERANRIKKMRIYTFVFNRKEKDRESGFHYYGERCCLTGIGIADA